MTLEMVGVIKLEGSWFLCLVGKKGDGQQVI